MKNPAQQLVDRDSAPAAVYIHFDRHRILEHYMAGQADLAAGRAVDEATTFLFFSVTKTLTAAAVLQLMEQGKLELDAPVVRYCPDFPYGDQINLRHLLTHTGGLPNPMPLRWVHFPETHDTFDDRAFFDRIFAAHPRATGEPGTKSRYSNLDYVWLGRVIEAVSGMRYEAWIEDRILRPAGVEATLGFRVDRVVQAKGYQRYWSFMNLMLGFFLDRDALMGPREGRWQPFRFTQLNGSAYGGLIGTPAALARIGQMMLGDQLLSPESKRLFFEAYTLNDGRPAEMALSWFTGALHGHAYRHHAGGGGGYYAEFRIYPSLGRGSVLVMNSTGMNDRKLLDRIDADRIASLKAN